jgi:hypothetical protein
MGCDGNNGRIGRDERAKSKDERLGNLRSLGKLESLENLGTTQRTLCVAIGFFGFREYHRRWYNEK